MSRKSITEDEITPFSTDSKKVDQKTGDLTDFFQEFREVNASIEFPSKLKINFYTDFYLESKEWIQCGDIFWLNHLDTKSVLVAKK